MVLVLAATTAVEAAAPSGIAALGLDVRALIFQVINFAILLLILYRFAWRPLLVALESRRQTIEEGLKTANELAMQREKLADRERQVLAEAAQQAEVLLARSQQERTRILAQAEATGEATATRYLEQAQAKLRDEAKQLRSELTGEVLGLVKTATETVLREKLDTTQDKALIDRALTEARDKRG